MDKFSLHFAVLSTKDYLLKISILSGPLGLVGGITAITVLALAVDAVSKYGFEQIGIAVVKDLQKEGYSKDEIRDKINSYPISKNLKNKILSIL